MADESKNEPNPYREEEWLKEGFDLLGELRKSTLPLVELAGPSPKGYWLVDLQSLGRPVEITNGDLKWAREDLAARGFDPDEPSLKIDREVDATNQPYQDSSLGGVFAAHLPEKIRQGTLKEVARVLSPGGIFVTQGGISGQEVAKAKELGLEIVQSKKGYWGDEVIHSAVVFQKPETKERVMGRNW